MKAVRMTKYPPLGIRSINPSVLESDDGDSLSPVEAARTLKAKDAVCFVQIETRDALANLDSIAAVSGVDVLLIGSMDITIELGILADWSNPIYQQVLIDVSNAAKKNDKHWGISGLFSRPDLWTHAVQHLGASFIVGALDMGLLSRGANANVVALRAAELQGIAEGS